MLKTADFERHKVCPTPTSAVPGQVAKEVARYFDEVPVASSGNTSCGAHLAECPYRLRFKA
jgi:hypothetical protein